MDGVVEQLVKLNQKDWLDVVGILLPIVLSIIIILQNILFYHRSRIEQQRLHNDEWKKQFHDDVLRIYGTYYVFYEVIYKTGFYWNVRNGNYYMVVNQKSQILSARDKIGENLDLARLIFGKNNENLYNLVEERFKLQTEIIDLYLKYIDSGRFFIVAEKAWDTTISSEKLPMISRYNYQSISNSSAYEVLAKMCESDEIKEIESRLNYCHKMHCYENYDAYFEDYFHVNDII